MSNSASAREDRLFELLATCIEASESERFEVRSQIVADNPEFADELNEYFAMHEQVDSVTGPLRDIRESTSDTAAADN